MIGWLQGKIIDKPQPGKLVLSVNGVGYDIETSLQTFFDLNSELDSISLYIHTLVREDAFLLYGFHSKQERTLFRALIKVNGIGPKAAMAILSSLSPEEFLQIISQQNVVKLVKLPGIGKKTAERLVIEMKDSVQKLYESTPHIPFTNLVMSVHDEAVGALETLGYKLSAAVDAVKKIDDGQKTSEQLIREALQILAFR